MCKFIVIALLTLTSFAVSAKDIHVIENLNMLSGNSSGAFSISNEDVPNVEVGDRVFADFRVQVDNTSVFQVQIGAVPMVNTAIAGLGGILFDENSTLAKFAKFKLHKTEDNVITGVINKKYLPDREYTIRVYFTVVKATFAISGSLGTEQLIAQP